MSEEDLFCIGLTIIALMLWVAEMAFLGAALHAN
jgi:hypothetical protein